MGQPIRRHATTRRVLFVQVAAAALAVGALSASVVVAASATASHQTKSVVISTAKNAKFGTILVSGKTLYTLKPSKVACTAQCLKIWPPVLLPKGVIKATAGAGVSSAKLGTVKRVGGTLQVTYGGKALYKFFDDTAAGQVHGNNVTDTWGTWSVVVTAKPAKTSIAPSSGSTPTTTPTPTTSPTPTTTPTTTPTPTTSPTPTTTPAKAPTTTTTDPGSGGVAF